MKAILTFLQGGKNMFTGAEIKEMDKKVEDLMYGEHEDKVENLMNILRQSIQSGEFKSYCANEYVRRKHARERGDGTNVVCYKRFPNIDCDTCNEQLTALLQKHISKEFGGCYRVELRRGGSDGQLIWTSSMEVRYDCPPFQKF